MAAQSSLLIRPGAPDLPEFVDIVCSGLDNTKSVELLINDIVQHTVAVDSDGTVNSTYNIPIGNVQDALVDLSACGSGINTPNIILCKSQTGLDDSIELRYKI